MKSKRITRVLTLGLLALSTAGLAAPADRAKSSKSSEGKYLVENVAMCGDCHTPMTPQGPDRTKWLKGGPLSFQPLQQVPNWQKVTPDITANGAVFRQWGEQGLVTFLTKGVDPSGNPPRPPMPAYRLHQRESEAIVEYLKTLK